MRSAVKDANWSGGFMFAGGKFLRGQNPAFFYSVIAALKPLRHPKAELPSGAKARHLSQFFMHDRRGCGKNRFQTSQRLKAR